MSSPIKANNYIFSFGFMLISCTHSLNLSLCGFIQMHLFVVLIKYSRITEKYLKGTWHLKPNMSDIHFIWEITSSILWCRLIHRFKINYVPRLLTALSQRICSNQSVLLLIIYIFRYVFIIHRWFNYYSSNAFLYHSVSLIPVH